MYVQINNIDRNIYMVASVVKNGKEITYKMINGVQLKEVFDSSSEAEAKYEDVIAMSGGGSNIPLDPDGKIPAEYLPSYVDDVEDLLAVTDTAPSTCAKGDKYYNTVSKKIFTATSANTWGSTGKTPEKDKIYVNTADDPASSWRWSGTDLVMIGGGTSNVPYIGIFDTLTLNLKTDNLVPGIYTPRTSEARLSIIGVNDSTTNHNKLLGDVIVLKKYEDTANNEYFCSFIDANLNGNVVQLRKDTSMATGYSELSNASCIQDYVYVKTLTRGNEAAYTPTGDYNPATKKYVDDNIKPVFLGTSGEHCTQQTALDLTNLDEGVYSLINSATTFSSPDKLLYVKITVNDVDKYASYNLDYNMRRPVIISVIKKAPYDSGLNVLAYINLNEVLDSNGKVGYSAGQVRYNSDSGIFDILTYINKTQPVTVGDDQTITSKKTFNTLPESSVVPTTDNQLVNKKYVDDNMGNIQYSTMPTASVDFLDEIIQYTGTTSNGYTKGYFYVCESDGGDPATYSWTQINVQPQGSSPSPVLPENGTRLLKKAANSVRALDNIQDAQVQDACLVLTDEVIEHSSSVEIDPFGVINIEEGSTIKFPKPTSFTFTGNVSNLEPLPNYSISIFSDVEPGDTERQATEWFGFNLAGPNPSDNSSWYMFEFIAGPSSSASELRASTGIVNAWVCADPSVDPTFIYIDDAATLATLVDSFGFDVYDYGMEEYTTHATMKYFTDQVALNSQGEHSFREFIPLNFEKEVVTTETYKKSDLYVYDGSQWVYTDRNLSANANWDENDPTAPGYVRGRTHYTIPGDGTGIETSVDVSDPSLAFEIKEDYEMYGNTYFDAYGPGLVESDAGPIIEVLNKLEELYQEGFVGRENPFKLVYGDYIKDVFLERNEVEGERLEYAIHNVEAILPDPEHQEVQPENVEIEAFFGWYIQDATKLYSCIVDILSSIYNAQGKLKVFTFSAGKPDVVVKLDPKYIPQTADWNENNSKSAGYIANRTHYKEAGTETRDIATEDLSEFDVSSSETEESVEYYTSHLEYRKNLESPHDEEGNIKAKDLYTDLSTIYDSLGSGTEVSIKVGDTIVSGKLLKYTHVVDPYNKTDLFVIATDGGELGDDENPMGTVADKFMTDSQNSSGVLLAVSYEMIQESN